VGTIVAQFFRLNLLSGRKEDLPLELSNKYGWNKGPERPGNAGGSIEPVPMESVCNAQFAEIPEKKIFSFLLGSAS